MERFNLLKGKDTGNALNFFRMSSAAFTPQEELPLGDAPKIRGNLTVQQIYARTEGPDILRFRKAGSYIVRRYLTGQDNTPEARKATQSRALLDYQGLIGIAQADIRTPSVIRFVQSYQGAPAILVSDVSCNGKYPTWSPTHQTFDELCAIANLTIPMVKQAADEIRTNAQKAAEAGFSLADRAYLIVSKDDQLLPFVVDPDDGIVNVRNSPYINPQELSFDNRMSAEQAIQRLYGSG